METFTIPDEVQTLVAKAEGDIVVAQRFMVACNDDYLQAGEILKVVKGRYREIEAKRKEMTSPLDEAKRKVMEFFRQPLDQLNNAERQIKSAMLSFTQEQERIRREQQDRLQALARAEQERLDKLAMEQITRAQEAGNIEKAEEILAATPQVAIPVVQSERPTVQGVKTVTRWTYKVVDEALIPREYLVPNERLLAHTAITTKGGVNIPGIEFYSESTIASSATGVGV